MTQFIAVKNGVVIFTVTAENFTDERITQLIKLAKRDFSGDITTYTAKNHGAKIGDKDFGFFNRVDTAINIVRKLLNKKGSQTYKYYLTTILKSLKACNILITREPYFVVQGVTITEINLNSIMTVNLLNNLFCTDEKPENAFAVFN